MDGELDRNQTLSSAGGKEKLVSQMLVHKVTGLGKSPCMKNKGGLK